MLVVTDCASDVGRGRFELTTLMLEPYVVALEASELCICTFAHNILVSKLSCAVLLC